MSDDSPSRFLPPGYRLPPSPLPPPPPPGYSAPPSYPPPPTAAWGTPYPGWAAPPPKGGKRRALLTLLIVGGVLVLLIAGLVVGVVVNRGQHRVSLTSPLSATRGKVVYSDNFSDPKSGWSTAPSPSATYRYQNGFVITASGGKIYNRLAPYTETIPQIGVSATATVDASSPLGAAFGPRCVQEETLADDFLYEFLLTNDGRWEIMRHQGQPTNPTERIREGTGPVGAGKQPATVVGICATQPGSDLTRLVMFVNGVKVGDTTDSHTLSSDGWVGGISVDGPAGAPTTVTFTDFEVSNASS